MRWIWEGSIKTVNRVKIADLISGGAIISGVLSINALFARRSEVWRVRRMMSGNTRGGGIGKWG